MKNIVLYDEKEVRDNLLPLTYTRPVSHIKQAIRVFAANLWCVVIPDLIISEQMHEQSLERELGVS